jgi:hypothetical protein
MFKVQDGKLGALAEGSKERRDAQSFLIYGSRD